MRKVSKVVGQAFINGEVKKMGNSHTDGKSLFLHNNRIAWKDGNKIKMTLCGWGTVTTRERLNSLCRLLDSPSGFHQSKGEQFFDNKPISKNDVVSPV